MFKHDRIYTKERKVIAPVTRVIQDKTKYNTKDRRKNKIREIDKYE